LVVAEQFCLLFDVECCLSRFRVRGSDDIEPPQGFSLKSLYLSATKSFTVRGDIQVEFKLSGALTFELIRLTDWMDAELCTRVSISLPACPVNLSLTRIPYFAGPSLSNSVPDG